MKYYNPLTCSCTTRLAVLSFTVRVQPLIHVDFVGEGVTQSDGCEEHLDADDEVLVTGGNRSLAHGEVRRVDPGDCAALLQDGQQHS